MVINVRDLKKDYADEGEVTQALRGVTFGIKQGEFVAIMGPSGSGKSTLLHILSFLDRPTGGTYTFQDKGIDEYSDDELATVRNKKMGFIFQAFNLLGHSTVFENVEIPLLYSDVPKSARARQIKEAVEAVGLGDRLYQAAGKLSGGQKQRIAIARALVNEPDVIFADEPTGNLDSVSGGQVMDIFAKLNKEGRTVILVTHETYTAEFADRVIRIKDGVVEKDEKIVKTHHKKFFK